MPPPAERRRDHESPAASDDPESPPEMTDDERTLRDMWLSEMWPVCPENGRIRPKRRRTAA